MCFLRSSLVLLVAAGFAVANPVLSGNYGGNSFRGLTGGYAGGNYGSGSNAYTAANTRTVARASASSSSASGSRSSGNVLRASSPVVALSSGSSKVGASSSSGSGLSTVSGNGFNGVSGNGFKAVGTLSSVPGVVFAFPSLTSVSYTRVPQQNNNLATLAILSALLADSSSSNINDNTSQNNVAAQKTVAHQTVARKTVTGTTASSARTNQGSNVAFVPVVSVPAASEGKTTKIVKTTIETDGSVSSIAGLNDDLDDIAAGPDSYAANTGATSTGRRSYSAASSSSSSRSGTSARRY